MVCMRYLKLTKAKRIHETVVTLTQLLKIWTYFILLLWATGPHMAIGFYFLFYILIIIDIFVTIVD
jgi:hypothetical protein